MFLVFSAIMSILITAFAAVVQWLTYATVPRFSRKTLTFEYDESVPVINKRLLNDGSLMVSYGGNALDNPHVIRLKIENVGKADVPTSAFDQATPIEFDFGVKVVAILREVYSPKSLIAPSVALSEQVLSIGPRLIPSGASLEYTLLVDGSCGGIVPRYLLEGVDLKRRVPGTVESGFKPLSMVRWALVAFIVWWIVQQPANAGHLVHEIGTLLSSAANGLSNFVASI